MFSIFKTIFRTGVILGVAGAVVAGGAYMIAGPDRAGAIMHQMHDGLMERIDQNIDDPVALRSQLAKLEREYPQRISQVRGDMAELREQIHQLDRDKAIALRVVELTDSDLLALDEKLSEASERIPGGNFRLASVSFENRVYDYDRAVARRNQIESTRRANTARAQDATHDLEYLQKQENRLAELLLRLETEHAQFQSQIEQLSRQVDAIARNERLIELMERRNKTIEECSRYEIVSLEQLTNRLAEFRSRQEAELDLLTTEQERQDYEEAARLQVDNEILGARQVPTREEVLEGVLQSSTTISAR
jgi:chromosome segregation ATPase